MGGAVMPCDHEYTAGGISAAERGTVPVFVCNRIMWRGYRASVGCIHCRGRTWVTLEQWNARKAPGTPDVVAVRHPLDGHQRELWPDPPNEIPEPDIYA